MDTKIKINLDAIMKDHNKDKDLIAPIDLETKKDSDISLFSNDEKVDKKNLIEELDIPLKTELVEEIVVPLKTNLVEEVIVPLKTELVEEVIAPLETELVEDKEVVWEESWGEKKVFISLDSIQKNSIDIWDLRIQNENKKKEPILVKQVINEPKKELFANYEAAFAKKKDSIMQKIQKLKNLPKTRPLFVSSLIIITVTWIWWLFYIDPKTHSLENYKTSIINIIDKNNLINDIWIVNDNWLTNEDKQPPPVIYEKEKIQLWWLKFEVETKVVDEKKIFKYDWKTYNSDEELKADMKIEVEKIKKAKLIDGIIKNFK